MTKIAVNTQSAKQMQGDIVESFGFHRISGFRSLLPNSEEFEKQIKEKDALIRKLRYKNTLDFGAVHQKITPVLSSEKKYELNFFEINKGELMTPIDAFLFLKRRGSLFLSLNELLFLWSFHQQSFPFDRPIFGLNEENLLSVDDEGHKRIPYVFNKENVGDSAVGHGTTEALLFEGSVVLEIKEM